MWIEEHSYDRLVHAIYGASLDPARWPSVTEDVARTLEARRAMLFTIAHTIQQGGFCYAHNIPQAAFDRWAATDEMAREDPFVRTITQRRLMVDGASLNGDDLVPHDQLVRTRFYKEWWRPFDIARLCTGIVFDGTDHHKLPAALSLYRSESDPRFSEADAHRLGRLLPHLSRSLGIMFHLRDRDAALAVSLAAMDKLTAGVVLLQAPDTVVFANRTAQKFLREGRYIRWSPGLGEPKSGLTLNERLKSQNKRFRQALAQSLSPVDLGGPTHFSNAILLPTPDGAPGSVLHVSPFISDHPNLATGMTHQRAILIAYDLESASRVRPELLSELFGLSPAEARAAVQVAVGGPMARVAERLGVSLNTLKTHLRAVYAKTQTHRQVDLLKLLLSLSAH